MVSACLEAYRATSDAWWYRAGSARLRLVPGLERSRAGALFHRAPAAAATRLHVDRVNQNQGAESTLAFLLSLAEMQLMQNAVTVFNQPAS